MFIIKNKGAKVQQILVPTKNGEDKLQISQTKIRFFDSLFRSAEIKFYFFESKTYARFSLLWRFFFLLWLLAFGYWLFSRKDAKNAKADFKGQQVNKTTRQQDLHTCGLVVLLSRCLYIFVSRLFAKTKRAFANAKAGRTLVFLYLGF